MRPGSHRANSLAYLDAKMLGLRATTSIASRRVLINRTYTTASSPNALLYLEHRNGVIESASLSALTAAEQLGGQVTGLIIGGKDEVSKIVEEAKK